MSRLNIITWGLIYGVILCSLILTARIGHYDLFFKIVGCVMAGDYLAFIGLAISQTIL